MAERSDKNVDLEWVAALKRRESALNEEERVRSICRPVIYRVHPYLRELKKEHFDHSVISLGLFDLFDKGAQNHSDIPTRTGDALKLNVVIKFLADVGETSDSWQRISAEVVREADKMKMLYDGHWDYHLLEGNIRSALALDAIFLTSFLEYKYYRHPKIMRRTDKIFWRPDLRIRKVLFQDIFKLENQVPLSLIKNVLGIRCRCYRPADLSTSQFYKSPNDTLNEICRQILDVWRYSFPSFQLPKAGIKLYDCHHLLHCQAQILWNSTETSAKVDSVRLTMSNENRHMQQREWLPDKYLPTAKELHQYGISFQGKDACLPRFKRHPVFYWRATLFLPKIEIIDDETEQRWRNFLAFEDAYYENDDSTTVSFRLYLEFMDQLIDDEEDVLLLCTGTNPVITWNGLADNRAVANLFNSIIVNHFASNNPQWASIRDDILNYHSHSSTKKTAKFMAIYTDEPWLVISVIAALVLLVLAFLQTIYTMKSSF